jgi:hypothetical protein
MSYLHYNQITAEFSIIYSDFCRDKAEIGNARKVNTDHRKD